MHRFAPPEVVAAAAEDIRACDFQKVRQIAHERFGLDLKPGKEALVSARLGKRVREEGLTSVRDLIALLEADKSGDRLAEFIDDLTTNYTSFLREPSHFQFLRAQVLSKWPPPKPLRIWSAGCSSGEEPYSILFTMLDAEPSAPETRIDILATDISRPALKAASNGVYARERFGELPREWIGRYLQQGQGRWNGHYRVKPAAARRIRFERRNLVESMHDLGKFHVIFCRNVMIYFDRALQEKLVGNFGEHLEPGGFLFIGHSEGLMGILHHLEFVQPAVYRKPGGR